MPYLKCYIDIDRASKEKSHHSSAKRSLWIFLSRLLVRTATHCHASVARPQSRFAIILMEPAAKSIGVSKTVGIYGEND